MTHGDGLTIHFHGTRGSYPACGPGILGYGGRTTCHEVRAGERTVLIDAGYGCLDAGRRLEEEHRRSGLPATVVLFFTHTHHDHMLGLPFFNLAYYRSSRFHVYGPSNLEGGIEAAVRAVFQYHNHPVPFGELPGAWSFTDLAGDELFVLRPGESVPERIADDAGAGADDLLIRAGRNANHPKTGVIHYRFELGGRSYVMATDTEGTLEGEPVLSAFARGADLLSHDAQYTPEEYDNGTPPRRGWGHSTWEMACAVAERAGVGRLALIHHDPEHPDELVDRIEASARGRFPDTFAVRDGTIIHL
jgi:ribonuclease BN (tRNA processing enzyme)